MSGRRIGEGGTRILDDEVRLYETALFKAAQQQDAYDLSTINLIAPASPTKPEYCDDLPLRHNAIAEGLLGKRPYAGAEAFNRIEQIAVQAACSLFGAEHANVQPHSVSQANQAVYAALLKPGDPVLAMSFDTGGHLTHGLSMNFSGALYDFSFYGVDENGRIDYEQIACQAERVRPKLIVCGASSYPRAIDFESIATSAHTVGARVLADLSHPAGLVATGRFTAPFPSCDVVTLTPDKTMLGGHGGLILCKEELKASIDRAVHPGTQSSVPLRRIYGLAKCLLDAHKPEFSVFIDRVITNMKVFERAFEPFAESMVTGGSDTHLMVVNTLKAFGLTGKDAETALETANILTNRQVVPGETMKPYVASGIRLGTTWSTARGFEPQEMEIVTNAIVSALENVHDETQLREIGEAMTNLSEIRRPLDVWKDIL